MNDSKKTMGINEYQELAHKFALLNEGTKEAFAYAVMGLAEETGEAVGKVAKYVRKNDTMPIGVEDALLEAVKPELGDVAWFLAECCTLLGLKLEDVMVANIEKLEDRQHRGVIVGEGDHR